MSQEIASSPERLFVDVNLLILLGKNIGVLSGPEKIRANDDHLSNESRMNAVAAGLLYRPGMKILFSGGKTAGQEVPSEATAMRDAMLCHFPEIPEEDIILEEVSIDSVSNAEQVSKILELSTKEYGRVGLLTVGYHVDNASDIFESYGIKIAERVASEDVISHISEHQKGFVERWSKSRRIKLERAKESLRSLIMIVDPKTRSLHTVAKKTRK